MEYSVDALRFIHPTTVLGLFKSAEMLGAQKPYREAYIYIR
jgi:hypothetical protein